jgi:hypothetical protein
MDCSNGHLVADISKLDLSEQERYKPVPFHLREDAARALDGKAEATINLNMTTQHAKSNAREGDGVADFDLQRELRAIAGDLNVSAITLGEIGLRGACIEARNKLHKLHEAIAALQAQQGADLPMLQRFAAGILGDDEIGSLDGGDIQDIAEACGLLVPTEVTAACGEACRCAEYGDFPQTCFRYSPALKRAYAAAAPATGAPR